MSEYKVELAQKGTGWKWRIYLSSGRCISFGFSFERDDAIKASTETLAEIMDQYPE